MVETVNQRYARRFASSVGAAVGDICNMRDRMDALEEVLRGLMDSYDDETGNMIIVPDRGCLVCTAGTTPDKYNTGLCSFHKAEKLLGK